MRTAKPVGFRAVAMVGVLVGAILCLLPASAVARGVRAPHATYTLPVREGVGFFTVRVVHPNPHVPPLVLYAAHPARLDCSAIFFDYRVSQLAANEKALGTLRLRMRCKHVPVGARISLRLRDPIVVRVPIRRSTGRVAFTLDKPPGRVLPLVSLRAERIGGRCRTRGARLRIRRLRLDFTSGVTCGRVTRRSSAVLTVGGLLRSGSTRGRSLRRRSAATPRARATSDAAGNPPITCTGQGAATVACTQTWTVGQGQNVTESYTFNGCPNSYHYAPVEWPGFRWSFAPATGSHADGNINGQWEFINYDPTPRTLNLTWFCGLDPPFGHPVITGAAVVGNTLNCTSGPNSNWTGYPTLFDNYEWLSDGQPVSSSQQYTVASSDYHHILGCSVLAHNAVGSAVENSFPSPFVVFGPPQPITQPTLLEWDTTSYSITLPGSQVTGYDWLKCSSDVSDWKDARTSIFPPKLTIQWLQQGPGPGVPPGSPISGETSSQYQVADTQAGAQVLCAVTASNQAGSTTALSPLSGVIQSSGGTGIL